MRVRNPVPFVERGGRLRGVVDLATGCYPAYLFGGRIGEQLPVFHLHEATVAALEPRLRHLAENGYRTVRADDIAAYVRDGAPLPDRAVALTFDDARASLWTVAAPLLRRHGLTAITFAIPGRINDASVVRHTIDDGVEPAAAAAEDDSAEPFATWPELKAMARSGVIEVHSHSRTHASIFCTDDRIGFVTPAFAREHILDRPLVAGLESPRFLSPSSLGAPLFARRSRLSDARRFIVQPDVIASLLETVAVAGGAAFFGRPDWEATLAAKCPPRCGHFENDDERLTAIRDEIMRSREMLDAQLGAGSTRHIALPWGVAGALALDALAASGFRTAFAEDLFRRRTVCRGDHPYQLMRLNGRFIPCLPGQGRRHFFSADVQR